MSKGTETSIVVVDDEPSIRELLVASLHFAGYEVETAASGSEAIEVIEKTQPDLIILDVMLPDIDGFTVTRRIRQQRNGEDYLYFYTEKHMTESGQWETEKPIAEKQYIRYLMEGDTSLHAVHKIKYRFTYNTTAFEIDVYPFCAERAVMRAALPVGQNTLDVPPQIEILREVTGDPAFKNRQLARHQTL